jgi:CelD/BcsL family acetyltransferase involved in cellulose biosynthesis
MNVTARTVHSLSTDPEYRVEVISDYDSLLGLRPVWDKLVEEAGVTHPFLSHEWVRTWWECFGAGKELQILVVKTGAEAVAIVPLMLSRARIYGFRVRRLEFLHNDHTPRFDFILARRPEEACRAIWNYLLAQGERWDLLELHQLPAGSPTLEYLPQLALDGGYLVGFRHAEKSPYLRFRGEWGSYAKRLSYNHRANVRKGLNRLTRRGDVQLEVISGGERLAGALNDGLRIEAAAWKESAGTAMRSRPDVERFYKMFAERAATALRLIFLTVDRTRIAFVYALCYRNKLYLLKAGYDPEYARYSPYNLLCYLVLREGFEHGLDEYEFLGSDEAWKLDWTQETKPHHGLFVFPQGLRARFLYYTKFRLVPILQRQRLYLRLRDAIFGRNRGAGGSALLVDRRNLAMAKSGRESREPIAVRGELRD